MKPYMLITTVGLLLATSGQAAHAEPTTIDEIVVQTSAPQSDETQMSADARALLSSAGDIGDPLKAILALPGISFAGGDFDEPVIRGMGPKDNRYLLDNIPMTHLFHDLSDSIVSDLVIRSFDLYPGVAPVQFGSATGGVVNLQLRRPSSKPRAVVDIGQIKSGLFVEGALSKNVSAYLSARENLARVFLSNYEEEDEFSRSKLPDSRDYTLKIAGETNQVRWSATSLGSFDRSTQEQRPGIPFPAYTFYEEDEQQVIAHALEFNRVYEDTGELSMTVAKVHNQTSERIGVDIHNEHRENIHSIRTQFTGQGESNLKAGFNLLENKITTQNQSQTILEASTYVSRDWHMTNNLTLESGLSAYYDDFHSDWGVDPRLSVIYKPTDYMSAYLAIGTASQRAIVDQNNIQTEHTQPRREARQLSLGVQMSPSDSVRFQAEAFYKDIKESEIDSAGNLHALTGEILGLDLIASKWFKNGIDGYIALSISENTRTNMDGLTYDYQFSIPASITAAINYRPDQYWHFSTKYRYQSGQPFTPARGLAIVRDQAPQILYGEPMSERSADYQRLDVRVEREFDWRYFDHASAYIDIINVLDHDNRSDETPTGVIQSLDGRYAPRRSGQNGLPLVVALGLRLEF